MIQHFPGVDFGLVIMGLHWAHGVKGGHVEGAELRALTELGLDILSNVVGVCRVLSLVRERERGRTCRIVVRWEAELDVVHERRVRVVC